MDDLKNFKLCIGEQLIGKKFYFECSCVFPIKQVGIIRKCQIINNEIIFSVDFNGKIISIGENHPGMKAKIM